MTSRADELLAEAETHIQSRDERFRRVLVAVVMVAAAFSTVTFLLMLLTWWRVETVVDQGHQQREEILDCTSPGGACFEASQDRMQEAVDQIVQQINEARARDIAALADLIKGERHRHGKTE